MISFKQLLFGPRRIDNLVAVTVPHSELKRFVFGQQRFWTKEFLQHECGLYHTVPIDRFPHYIFLKDHLDDPFTDNVYLRYFIAKRRFEDTLSQEETKKVLREKIHNFIALYHSVELRVRQDHRPFFDKPVTACIRPDNKWILIHGNHRAAVALKLGIDLPVRFVKTEKYLTEISVAAVPTQADSKANAMPTLSIFYDNRELVRGRKRDTAELMSFLERKDIAGKTVLDLGCNIGIRSFMAAAMGAKHVIGIDRNAGLIDSAVRLNTYFAAPVNFFILDLEGGLPDIAQADTVLCFSISDKIKNRAQLIQTLCRKSNSVFYIDFTTEDEFKSYYSLLNECGFSLSEKIPMKSGSATTPQNSKMIFRCEVRKRV